MSGLLQFDLAMPLCRSSFLLLLAAPFAQAALTPLQTVSFPELSTGDFATVEDGISGWSSTALEGFARFDPALGTLTEVRLGVELSGTFQIALYAWAEGDDVPPSGETFDVFFEAFSSGLHAGLVYNTSPTTALLAAGGSYGFPSLGTFDEPVDWWTYEDEEYAYLDYVDDYGEESFGPERATGSLSPADEAIQLSDFVGTGSVDVLEAFLYFDIFGSDLTVANLPSANVDIEVTVTLQGGHATLQYLYDPGIAVIPEPGAAALLVGLVSLGTLALRRRGR
ncbi:MAG: hypothetical protein ACLFR7_00305 [Opitutales bacterium]